MLYFINYNILNEEKLGIPRKYIYLWELIFTTGILRHNRILIWVLILAKKKYPHFLQVPPVTTCHVHDYWL